LFDEGFIDIRETGLSGDNYYYLENNPPYYNKIKGSINKLFLRKTVSGKFVKANQELKDYGIELYFFDCFRPIEVQKYFYEEWYLIVLKQMFPELSEQEILDKRDLFTAKPYNSYENIDIDSPPPHSTGAAADVTLRFIDTKAHLFMGTIYDEVTELVYTSFYEEQLSKGASLTLSEMEALKNRRLLYWVLKNKGFENYLNEWWHFSYCDQMWAKFSNTTEAFYSKMRVES
jgi:zinc D-Ala-D-Ala dipeptidase